MRHICILILLLFGASNALAASNDVLLNLKDPASSNPLFPTLRVEGKMDGATNPTVKVPMLPCVANAVAPTWAEGSIVPCSTDLAGALRTSAGGGGGGGTSSLFGAAFPASGTAAGYFDGTSMQGGRVHDLDTGAGTEYNLGVNLRFGAGGGSVEAGTVANPIRIDPTGTTTQPISAVGLPLPTGAATEATLATRLADATFTGRFATAFLSGDAIANQTTTAIHGFGYMFNGATWDRIRGTIADGILVNLGANNDVTVTGTVAVSNAFLLDATFTGRFPVASVPADNESNAVSLTRIGNFAYIFDGAAWDRWTGAVSQSGTWNIGTVTTVTTVGAVTSITNPVTVLGNKTHNNAAPGATNVGTLPCIATAVAPTNTEGNQTSCSQNLNGAQRTIEQNFISTANDDGSCPSGAASFTVAASNASRTWIAVWGSPANTDDVYIKLGTTATAADARIAPGQPINFVTGRIYTGRIDAFPSSGTQAVCVMELN